MKKIIALFAILFASTMIFASCEKKSETNPEFDALNELMDNSVENWDEAALDSLKNNNNENMIKIDQFAKPVAWDMIATFETSMWDVKVKLFPTATPKTVENFKWLADKWYYNWTVFHRIIKDFMIQWWDPTATWAWWESFFWADFEDEPHADLKNVKWALSMANRWANTNWSQFFIVQAEATPWLDWYQNWQKTCGIPWTSCHTVFWQVFEWMDIVDEISVVETNPMDKPMEDVVVKSIKVEILK